VRNKVKRQLREAWRARLDAIPPENDYVLVAKPGLPAAIEANGFEWLGERLDEVLGKALGGSAGTDSAGTGGSAGAAIGGAA